MLPLVTKVKHDAYNVRKHFMYEFIYLETLGSIYVG